MTIFAAMRRLLVIVCLSVPGLVAAEGLPTGDFTLTTQFREGQKECLEGNQVNGVRGGGSFLDRCQNVSGQLWRVVPVEGDYFRLNTLFREYFNECLEGNQVNGDLGGAAFIATCQNVSGQLWKAVPLTN